MTVERARPEVLDVLSRAVCEGQELRLPDESLERDVYEAVADVLSRIGGKWKRRGKAKDGVPQGVHLFPYDPAPLLEAFLETGDLPPKNPTAFFPTPPDVVDRMLKWCELDRFDFEGRRILEPSAGIGAIAEAAREAAPLATLDTVEVLPINAAMLRRKGFEPHTGDFLEWKPDYEYDAVLMNPPFSVDGDRLAYITHIEHAWSLLREGGELVSITPTAWQFRSDKRSRDFMAMVGEYGDSDEIEEGAFKESGTTIATRLVWMRKDDQAWKAEPHNGYPSWHVFAACLWESCERELNDARYRIFDRLDAKELPLDLFGKPTGDTITAIREHWEAVVEHANKHHQGIRPTDADWLALIDETMDDYAEHVAWENRDGEELRDAA